MELGQAADNQRDDANRWAFSWLTVFFGFALSRRKEHRRIADDDVVFLDWHHLWLLSFLPKRKF